MEIFFPLSLFLFPIRGKSADPRVFLNRRDRAATLTAIRGHQGSDGFNRNRVCLLFVGKIFQIRLGYDLANLDRLDRERIWIVVEKKKKKLIQFRETYLKQNVRFRSVLITGEGNIKNDRHLAHSWQ